MIRHPELGRRRPGFSLLEVLVALAIFLFALVGIGRLITWGGDQALEVKFKSQATKLCQAKLSEVIAGAVALSSQSDVPLDEDPSWTWSLDAEQGNFPGLWNVTVRVNRTRPGGARLEASLSRMVLDPSLRGSTADATALAAAAAANNSSASSSGSNSATTPAGSPSSPTAAGGAKPAASAGAAAKSSAPSAGASSAPKAATGKTSGAASSSPSKPASTGSAGKSSTSGTSKGGN
jgi:general secretion pathway protein I